ncbi:hypothetical protein PtB15_2B183 [Puccinia triticina]|nr:hypothetical protein PtB15_2B183 [Puccinia triticina]
MAANTQDRAISGLVASFGALGARARPRQIRDYEVLFVDELTRIRATYLALWDSTVRPADPLVLYNQVDKRKRLLAQLHSKDLPALKRQVVSLSKVLVGQLDGIVTPISKIQLVLKVLANLDTTMSKLKFAIACISPDLETGEVRHDKDFEKLKAFICSRLAARVYALTEDVCELLQMYRDLIQEAGHDFGHLPQKKTQVLTTTEMCVDSIDEALAFMDKSELNHIQDEWRASIDLLDETLEAFARFASQAPSCFTEQSRHSAILQAMSRPEDDSEEHPDADRRTETLILLQPRPGMPQAQMTALVIASVKLSRLLMAQLLKISRDTNHFRMVPDSTTRELDVFVTLTTKLAISIKDVVLALSEGIAEDRFDDPVFLRDSIAAVVSTPEVILVMMDSFFVPLFGHDSPKIFHKYWFCQWNNLYRRVIKVYTECVGSLVARRP